MSFLIGTLKAVLALLLAYNIRAFPLVWHVRVLAPVLRLRFRRSNPHALAKAVKGQSPTEIKTVVPGFRVWPSDVDYNLHKSNSTYASDMDVARSNVATEWFGPFLAVGGLLPIAATTHRFFHELLPLAKYDIEISYGGFGEKWIYCVGLFVTHPKASSSSKKPVVDSNGSVSGTSTPVFKKMTTTRADGAIIHAVSVSIFCFKLGRLTIPPAVVLSMCGYGDPKNYARFLRLHAQGPKATLKYLKGEWKEDEEVVKSVQEFEKQGSGATSKGELMRKILEEYGVQAPA